MFSLYHMWLLLPRLSHGPIWLLVPFCLHSNWQKKKRRKRQKEEGHTSPFEDTCLGDTISLLLIFHWQTLSFDHTTLKRRLRNVVFIEVASHGVSISKEEGRTDIRKQLVNVHPRCYLWRLYSVTWLSLRFGSLIAWVQLWHLPAMWSWKTYWISLCLSFLVCKTGIIIEPASEVLLGD